MAEAAGLSRHRSIYLPLLRGLVPNSLEVFDFAEQGMVTGSRDNTTVAPQALYLLNDPFVRQQSLALAERLLTEPEPADARRIDRAYRLILGRSPSASEIERAAAYLVVYEDAWHTEQQRFVQAAAADQSSTAKGPTADAAASNAPEAAQPPKRPADVVNPDDIEAADELPPEIVIEPKTARATTWSSFVQALLGTAEFRYLK